MSSSLRWILVPVLTLFASVASAEFHTYQIEQIFSDASGNIQFIVMHESMGMSSENFWMGNKLTSTSRLGVTKTFTFSSNLPGVMCGYYTCQGSTAFTRVLIGTQGFRDLGIVNPDYIIPNGFIAIDGGTINYAFVDQVTYSALPTDGVSAIDRGGTSIHNLATNFAGNSASVSALAANYQGLWWVPAGLESGWGLNLAHQAATIFATWFTYDTDGTPLWLSATLSKGVGESFSGALLKTAGPAFNAVPFDPNAVTRTTVGNATLSFSDGDTGAFDY